MKDYYDMTPEEQLAEDTAIAKQMDDAWAHNTWMVKKEYPPLPTHGKRWEDLSEQEQNVLRDELDKLDKQMDEIADNVIQRLDNFSTEDKYKVSKT